MNNEYIRGYEKGDFSKYNKMLNDISSKGKINRNKLLDLHVESGTYFYIPLTLTKVETPTKEQILEKYPGNNELVKFMHHGKRRNTSKLDLVPAFLVKNAILTDNVKRRFGDIHPFMKLKLVQNAYGKNETDALGYPACYLSSVPISSSMINTSKSLSIDILQQMRIKEIKNRKKKNKGIEI